MSKMERFRVRDAVKNDCQHILRLIQELADYEKMPDAPKIGVDVSKKVAFIMARYGLHIVID